MVLGGAGEFLLKVNRSYIYCLSFPLIKKEVPDAYGDKIYKIGISTQSEADKRLDSYLTYFSPFSYEVHCFLVFPKDTKREIVKKAEQSIFDRLHRLSGEAKVYPTTARINRFSIQDRDSREWWEARLSVIERVFRQERNALKPTANPYLIVHSQLDRRFRLIAGPNRAIPKEIALTKQEAEMNKEAIEKVQERAKAYLETLTPKERDRWLKPFKYFEIDNSFSS
jgi:hypothetical protein